MVLPVASRWRYDCWWIWGCKRVQTGTLNKRVKYGEDDVMRSRVMRRRSFMANHRKSMPRHRGGLRLRVTAFGICNLQLVEAVLMKFEVWHNNVLCTGRQSVKRVTSCRQWAELRLRSDIDTRICSGRDADQSQQVWARDDHVWRSYAGFKAFLAVRKQEKTWEPGHAPLTITKAHHFNIV